ncbi:MAG: flavin reductase family protein [Acetobacteraceae bacterium]
MLFDFAALAPNDRYKLLAATVVPRPIAWVVTADAAGRRNAAPFSFFNVLAGDPPVIGIGIGDRPSGTMKDTGANIRATGEFVVNLVDEASAAQMNLTATDFAQGEDELALVGLDTLPSARVAPPRIARSPVALECRLRQSLDLGGGRSIVIGEVLAIHVADEAVLDAARCHIDTPRLDLIGRMHGGGWYSRTTDRFDLPRVSLAAWRQRRDQP